MAGPFEGPPQLRDRRSISRLERLGCVIHNRFRFGSSARAVRWSRINSSYACGRRERDVGTFIRHCVVRSLARFFATTLLACWMLAPRAWDADTMLRAAQAQGPQAVAGAKALQLLMAELTGPDEPPKLVAINDFFNRRIVFTPDPEVWGQADYWASPLEMLGKGRGDCEDYVIAKYFSLIGAGVPMSKLRLVYVRAMVGGPGGDVLAQLRPLAPPCVLVSENLCSHILGV